jgi:quercetin dioxygenase-like cupin family protein
MKTPIPIIVPPESGQRLQAFGEEVIIHLGGEQTGGKLTLWSEFVPPGGGPPPHRHHNEDEWFVVQEGLFEFLADGKFHKLGPGGVAFMPRNSVHTFKNIGDGPGRLLVSTTPSGFEIFFGKCACEFANPDGPDMPKIMAIAAEHGIEFVNPE